MLKGVVITNDLDGLSSFCQSFSAFIELNNFHRTLESASSMHRIPETVIFINNNCQDIGNNKSLQSHLAAFNPGIIFIQYDANENFSDILERLLAQCEMLIH